MSTNTGPRPQFGHKPFHGSSYKGNTNFKSTSGYKGKSFNSGSSSGFPANTTRHNGSNAWSGNTNTRSNVVVECQICNKRGHTAVNCFRKNSTMLSPGFIVKCQICGKRGHYALECYQISNYAYQAQPPPPSFNAMAAQHSTKFSPNDAWIVDFGVSNHITTDVDSLNQVTSFQGSKKITVGNGPGLSIANTGSTIMKTKASDLVLNNVLHVPNISRSLLSVQQLCANNHSWFICNDREFFVQDKKTRETLYHGKSRPRQLFQIPVVESLKGMHSAVQQSSGFLGQMVKSSIWHQRMCHPTNEIIAVMLKQSGISVDVDDNHSILSFSSRIDKCTSHFEKIHSDIWGPSPVKSSEEYRYYVTFLDEYTRYTWIFPLCNKSDFLSIGVESMLVTHLKPFLVQKGQNR
ncbi:hypothetical protein D8674_005721 [Pyrus ussuriensis x Pyrus communis]|uniref:CCHC-type domain-containing protein n=1 Tax=Pyrus ussuriensis x Pyrus communis TaxID=2448454 RepID=A0A5N5G5Y8_9ROSA|nr:hypothetical protein D8674_005721 [Pyrus ussuriensis x Pyrus communis]